MNKIIPVLLSTTIAMGLSGCGPGGINNQAGGTLAGAALGGLLGSTVGGGSGQVAAAVGGALIGGYLGNRIGASMDQQDQINMSHAIINTPINQQASWTNPKSHTTYTVTPLKNYHHHGRYCREYQTTIIVGGKKRRAYGRACRELDGSWQIVK